jgi:NAD(P)-dependent dehydrogenase (short-subunit alcohol dehydrogenase family)
VRRLAAKNPKKIFLCARTPSKAQAVIDEIKALNGVIQAVKYDLSSLESTRSAAAEILASTDRLDLLFLNAGVSGLAPALTEEGYEWQFGVNYVSHALFAQLLLPLLLETAAQPNSDVRIITVASEAAKVFPPKAGILLDQVKTDLSSISGMARYGQSKLANLLLSNKLAQVYPSITSIAVHPGMVNTENFSKADGAGWFTYFWQLLLVTTGVTTEEGAKTQLWAATSKDAKTGKFYFPIGKEDDGGKYGKDQKKADELWSWTTKELAAQGGSGWPKV